jgi:hypothetical protein
MGIDGSGWPDGWETFGGTVDIRSNMGRVVTVGGSDEGAGASRPGVENGEILLVWQWTDDLGQPYLQLRCRQQDDEGYGLMVDGEEVMLRRLESDDNTDLATSSKPFEAGTWYWTRFHWSGPALQGRVWRDGDPEPTRWDVEATDESYTAAGQVMIQILTDGDGDGEQGMLFDEFWLVRDVSAPQLLFIGDFETGDLAQWADAVDTDGDLEPELVTEPVRTPGSGYACSFRVESPQIRCELDGSDRGGTLIQRESSDCYYGWSVMFRGPFPVGLWQIAGQWHANSNSGDIWDEASPPVSVTMASTLPGLDPTRWYLDGGRSGVSANFPLWSYDLGPMVVDRWVDLVTRIVPSTRPERGRLQAWVDGRLVVDAVPPAPLLYPTTNPDRYNYLKVGYCRHHEITTPGVVLFDNVRVGRSFASVDPSAY